MSLKFGLLLGLSLIFVSGCTPAPPETIDYDTVCVQMGYVPREEANKVIDLTNDLIDVTNMCLNESYEYISYYEVG